MLWDLVRISCSSFSYKDNIVIWILHLQKLGYDLYMLKNFLQWLSVNTEDTDDLKCFFFLCLVETSNWIDASLLFVCNN
jgi:hypothetical protein